MVATVLKLRYRILGNSLVRRPWQLVGFCFGIVWALSILAMVVASLMTARNSETVLDNTRTGWFIQSPGQPSRAARSGDVGPVDLDAPRRH